MTSIDVPRNSAQKITGGIKPTVQVVFPDQITPTSFLIYTVPAGLTEKVNVLVTDVNFPVSTGNPNIRIRVATNLIKQFNRTASADDTGKEFQSLDYILQGGDTIDITTSNTTTARTQSCSATVSVLQSVKQ